MQIVTSWYDVPLLKCMTGMKNYCTEISNSELLVCGVFVDSTFYMLGFARTEVEINDFSNPVLLSNNEFSTDEQKEVIVGTLQRVSEEFNIFLHVNIIRGTVICQEFTEHLKDLLLADFMGVR